jgi:hypothetical protein
LRAVRRPALKDPEFLRRAVELARLGEGPTAQIAKDLGIAESGLRRWMAQADEVKKEGLTRSGRSRRLRATESAMAIPAVPWEWFGLRDGAPGRGADSDGRGCKSSRGFAECLRDHGFLESTNM